MSVQSELEDRYVKLAITLKTNELQRKQLSSLMYQHVESMLHEKWKIEKPKPLHQVVEQIMQLEANDVIAYLSTQAIILGSKMKIHDFEDLIGGKKL